MERDLQCPLGRLEQIRACLGVQKVRGGHVGQRLSRGHRCSVHGAGGASVEVQRAELMVTVAQRKREHRREPLFHRTQREPWKPNLCSQVRYGERLTRLISGDTRTLPQRRLDLLKPQRRFIGRGDVVRAGTTRDQRHTSAADRQHIHDPNNEMIQDRLNGKVRHQSPRELDQHVRKPTLDFHNTTSAANYELGREDWAEMIKLAHLTKYTWKTHRAIIPPIWTVGLHLMQLTTAGRRSRSAPRGRPNSNQRRNSVHRRWLPGTGSPTVLWYHTHGQRRSRRPGISACGEPGFRAGAASQRASAIETTRAV